MEDQVASTSYPRTKNLDTMARTVAVLVKSGVPKRKAVDRVQKMSRQRMWQIIWAHERGPAK
jgi:hypothetical protein